jgi:hypothetical protein
VLGEIAADESDPGRAALAREAIAHRPDGVRQRRFSHRRDVFAAMRWPPAHRRAEI